MASRRQTWALTDHSTAPDALVAAAKAALADLFEEALAAELVRLETLVAPLLHRLLQVPLLETEFPA